MIYVEANVSGSDERSRRRNLTVHLGDETIRRAKLLAAREGTSVSRPIALTIERLVAEDDAYEAAKRRALALIERGFHLGGRVPGSRADLHERR